MAESSGHQPKTSVDKTCVLGFKMHTLTYNLEADTLFLTYLQFV